MDNSLIRTTIEDVCNPVSQGALLSIVSSFEELGYEDWLPKMYELVNIDESERESDLPLLLTGILVNEAHKVMQDLGLFFDINIMKIEEVSTALRFIVDVEVVDIVTARNVIALNDHSDDGSVETLSHILELMIGTSFSRWYQIIDEVKPSFFINFIKIMRDKAESIDSDDMHEDELLFKGRTRLLLLKTFKMLNGKTDSSHRLLALKIINTEATLDLPLTTLISAYFDSRDVTTLEKEALDVVSLILLSKDKRHNILDSYVEYIDDIYDDETHKSLIYEYIKEFTVIVEDFIIEKDVYKVFNGVEDEV